MSDLTGSRFEPQISRSRDKRFTAQLTGWSKYIFNSILHGVFDQRILQEGRAKMPRI